MHAICSCTVMRSLDDTIHDRIAEMHVWIRHIEFCAKHHAAFYGLRSIHLLKQSKVSSIGRSRYGLAVPGVVGVPFCCAISSAVCSSIYALPFLIIQTANPKLLKVVRSIVDIAPLETEPLDVLKNILYIFIISLLGLVSSNEDCKHHYISLQHQSPCR